MRYADSLCVSTYFCNHYKSDVEYDYQMAKVDWLTTAVLLILSSIGLVNGQFEAFSSKLEA